MTLSTRAEDTRHLLYNELAATGTLPSRSALAERLGIAKRSFGFSVMGRVRMGRLRDPQLGPQLALGSFRNDQPRVQTLRTHGP